MQALNKKEATKLKILFWGIVASRLFLMIFLPLTDTTEARYSNIALIMSKTGDWITPYFDYGIPYWGKPPLSFWFQALSYDIFGIYDFVPRIPSLLITLGTAWIIYKFIKILKDEITALWAIIIYFSSLLVYALSGTVLLDPYLTFAITLSYASFTMVLNGHKRYWGYLFFIGLGIGLLAKGPLAIVLVGGVMFIWIIFSPKNRICSLRLLPWISGFLLMSLIAVPWYVMAELKTPGFLHYFIIGEHLDRFLDAGWKGDKYGHAHFKPLGSIWFMWLYTSLPWGLIGVIIAVKKLFIRNDRYLIFKKIREDNTSLFLVWMLFPMLFFTMSENITPTYVLYGFPALGILLATYYKSFDNHMQKKYKNIFLSGALLIPALGILGTFYVIKVAPSLKTEKFLIQKYKNIAKNNEPIYFLNHKEFSEVYYMNRNINTITMKQLKKAVKKYPKQSYFIVGQNDEDIRKDNDFKNLIVIYKSARNTLYENK